MGTLSELLLRMIPLMLTSPMIQLGHWSTIQKMEIHTSAISIFADPRSYHDIPSEISTDILAKITLNNFMHTAIQKSLF
jgi:hypothetical protein